MTYKRKKIMVFQIHAILTQAINFIIYGISATIHPGADPCNIYLFVLFCVLFVALYLFSSVYLTRNENLTGFPIFIGYLGTAVLSLMMIYSLYRHGIYSGIIAMVIAIIVECISFIVIIYWEKIIRLFKKKGEKKKR